MRSKKWMGITKSKRFREAVAVAAVGLMICAVAAAMVVAARKPSQSTGISAKTAKTTSIVLSKTQKQPATQARATNVSAPDSSAASTSSAAGREPAAVTITGCLERDADAFWLKDTRGVDAPKSRSWKSGFLKKGAASIEVVDPSNTLKLPTHVGHRVSLTGMLAEREMQGRSVQRVPGVCE
jgi:hypothetical protein